MYISGEGNAGDKIEIVKKQMTREQIAKAKAIAARCFESNGFYPDFTDTPEKADKLSCDSPQHPYDATTQQLVNAPIVKSLREYQPQTFGSSHELLLRIPCKAQTHTRGKLTVG